MLALDCYETDSVVSTNVSTNVSINVSTNVSANVSANVSSNGLRHQSYIVESEGNPIFCTISHRATGIAHTFKCTMTL